MCCIYNFVQYIYLLFRMRLIFHCRSNMTEDLYCSWKQSLFFFFLWTVLTLGHVLFSQRHCWRDMALFQEEEKIQNIPPTQTTVCCIDSVSLGKVFQLVLLLLFLFGWLISHTEVLCSRSDWLLGTLKSLHMASGFMIINVASVSHGWVDQGRYTVNRADLLLQERFIDIKQLQEVQSGRLIALPSYALLTCNILWRDYISMWSVCKLCPSILRASFSLYRIVCYVTASNVFQSLKETQKLCLILFAQLSHI